MRFSFGVCLFCVCVHVCFAEGKNSSQAVQRAPWSMPTRHFVMLKWIGHLNPSIKFSPTFCLKIVMASDDNLLRPIIFQVLQSDYFLVLSSFCIY